MTEIMDAALTRPDTKSPGDELLLRHCFALGGPGEQRRVPARLRLEAALGPELARKLIASLTVSSRR